MPSAAPFGRNEKLVVPRIGDIYAAMPAITGKLELEYEGEMKGADNVARELIRTAVGQNLRRLFQRHRHEAGGAVVRSRRRDPAADTASAADALQVVRGIQGLMEKTGQAGRGPEGHVPKCRSPPPSSCSKACTRTSASAATKSASSAPARSSRSRLKSHFEREEVPFPRGTKRPFN